MNITLHDVSHDYTGTTVLEHVAGGIGPSDRIGLVGANGSGKTTLLRIIAGEIEPVGGTCTRTPDTRTGYVPQHLASGEEETVGDLLLARVRTLRARLRELELAMADAGSDSARLSPILADYELARDTYESLDGDVAEERALGLLGEMGLSCDLPQLVSTLSGGERNVLGLARALVERPNLLILDEPGNHLDFAGLAWLESYLVRFPGAVLLVSHNRYLLDRVVTGIWELFDHHVTAYSGNYSEFRFQRLTQALSDQATYVVQQRKLTRLEALVKTFEQRARTTGDPAWGNRLRARRSQLEKARELALAQPVVGGRSIEVQFADGDVRSDIAIEVKDLDLSVAGRELFRSANLLVHVGERVGIVGPNGCGKTTFLTNLITHGAWEHPKLRIGPSMRVGFCAQHRGRFPAGTSILDAMLTTGNHTRKEVFGTLSRLLFVWEDLDRTVGSLSGGEWNRLQLGLAILARANLLVLDEPTNHLDIPSREAVEEALSEFAGTVVAVSHDRYFLDASVSRIEEIEGLQFVTWPGNFSEFWRARGGGQRVERATAAGRKKQVGSHRKRTRVADGDPDTEREIMTLEEQIEGLEHEMTAAFERGAHQEGRRISGEITRIRKRVNELYSRWGSEA
jgi:ATP-binding cassette subfamily F protein 3